MVGFWAANIICRVMIQDLLARRSEAFLSSARPKDMETRKLGISLIASPSTSPQSATLLTAITIGKMNPFCHCGPKHLRRRCSGFE